jgi:hypothetical protein
MRRRKMVVPPLEGHEQELCKCQNGTRSRVFLDYGFEREHLQNNAELATYSPKFIRA